MSFLWNIIPSTVFFVCFYLPDFNIDFVNYISISLLLISL
ncbi:hypothetical protein ECPA9_2203 [Escherichia coli PA9]|nr:hypothetical protein ECPA9_2203 [Escherichia coli PA9]